MMTLFNYYIQHNVVKKSGKRYKIQNSSAQGSCFVCLDRIQELLAYSVAESF